MLLYGVVTYSDAVDHQRHGLELSGRGAVIGERRLPVLPLPGRPQPGDVGGVDVGERRVALAALVAAVVQPFDLLGGLLLRTRRRSRR